MTLYHCPTTILNIISISLIVILSGCTEEDYQAECPERYIKDYEYITLDDGSVITGAPIYECNWFETEI